MTRVSAIADTAVQLYGNNIIKMIATLKVTQGLRNRRQSIGHRARQVETTSLSTLHRVRDITTSTLYVTACDLGKSFSFDKRVHMCDIACGAILLSIELSLFLEDEDELKLHMPCALRYPIWI